MIAARADFATGSSYARVLALVRRPGVVVALVYAALFFWYAVLYNYTALDFVHVGTIFSQKDPEGGWGYDGQFYYYVARDPATAASFLDNPS
ncbi:MAG TPA: hypothetical protein VGW38_21740, partial [Chloroflexota bacterium]|nr:hypothetical protein [Chloroflexota bacterium]